jgi:ribonuclease-3
MIDEESCQRNLGISFNDVSLLEQAFVHSSYLNENPNFPLSDNERLEFLGDAVLESVVTEELYKEFPDLPEGELTMIRARLVRRETLAELASSIKLGDYLMLGQGEEASGGRTRQSNLANAMEALIGAIYLDQGLAEVKQFILRQLKPTLEKVKAGEMPLNYKALVQEFIQREKKSIPVYQLVQTIGPDHNKQFTVEVLLEGKVMGKGVAKNKKAAEMEAAKSAWEKLRYSHG